MRFLLVADVRVMDLYNVLLKAVQCFESKLNKETSHTKVSIILGCVECNRIVSYILSVNYYLLKKKAYQENSVKRKRYFFVRLILKSYFTGTVS